ncbi:dicer-like protein-like protein 2 [Plenodomus tracheiphilus IPT5]|uniref:Dicer-like protein-like protein 2 n=1 Tax=Plenodomus tracheiphilus IPT5 TaxID=1408161 RepID=A0A6A7B057_9PLEO|nr:dicer-like protein-like protein 2 [Plenodomus tracheiphilus IPT5]
MADRYSFSLTTFSPSGKLVQIEYALNAVNQGVTSLGIKATNGIVLATEKKSSSPLIDSQSSSKVSLITPNIGMVYSGMGPDYRVLVDKARKVSHTGYKRVYNEYPPTRILVQDVARVMQEATQSGGVRPYGVSLLIAGWDDGIEPEAEGKSEEQTSEEKKKVSGKTGGILKGGPSLYQVDPSGSYFPWKATAIGKSATSAKTFLEKRYTEGLELEDAIHIALLTLKETIEGEMNGETVEIGIVGPPEERLLGVEGVEGAVGPRFRKLSPSEVEDYLTNLAIERTRAELEICKPDKLVWFLAPTVTLCEQQYEVFKSHLPGYGIRILSGKDDVDHWTDQDIWDAVLRNVRVVLSTHKVLLDALTHGFVRMSKLALLIFDEAHHCTLKHPAHKIMSDFYKPFVGAESRSNLLPKVLGLSASPVMKAAATKEALEEIEHNLRAITRTPKLHHSELIRFVNKPELVQITYPIPSPSDTFSPLLLALQDSVATYNIRTDPYTLELIKKQQSGYDVTKQLEKLFVNRKTYCNQQLRNLAIKALAIAEELGISAMEWYLHQCVAHCKGVADIASDQQLLDTTVHEKQHLMRILESLPLPKDKSGSSMSLSKLSQKVEILINTLVSEIEICPDFTGLVFIEQRVFVAGLAHILATHPRIQGLFRVGTFVGTSESSKRNANIANFVEPRNQQSTLDDFRTGRTNLILTTSVLEEGIDVLSCNLVLCFERPKNLKSFVQRRGRARKQGSKYIIFTPQVPGSRSSESWQSLEAEMRRAYEDDLRLVQIADERENGEEKDDGREFRVPSTGALLTLDNASQHLYHFCAVSATDSFVDSRPQFEFSDLRTGSITSQVRLPIFIDPSVRKASCLKSWKTERMARKDAAFEAYKALYQVGLVNDNLLPVCQNADSEALGTDRTPSIIEASPLFDPWDHMALSQQHWPYRWYRTLLTLSSSGEQSISFVLFTSILFPISGSEIKLYWNQTRQYLVSCSWLPGMNLAEQEVQTLRSITRNMLYPIFHGRMAENRDDFLCLLGPCDEGGSALNSAALSAWEASMKGQQPLADLVDSGQFVPSTCGLISIPSVSHKFILNTEPSNYSMRSEVPTVWANRFPKRRDFLHPELGDHCQVKPKTRADLLAVTDCTVDNLPIQHSFFALLFPSILHRLECDLIADQLRTTLLAPVSFEPLDLPMVMMALTSSSADDTENYQRLEFFGDCILKFVTSLHLMAANLKEPESFLTQKKGNIVSNGSLARASVAAGLDQYVITKRFTGAKWQPKLLGDMLTVANPPTRRKLSSKLIADVIESLIGASFVVGGFSKAFTCIQTLLPTEDWIPMPEANTMLHVAYEGPAVTGLHTLESLIGHAFSNKTILLDAITHPSYQGPNANWSYNRLEYLGDAVLDFIITKRLYAHNPQLPHKIMHTIRTAMVNASFLAFSMFETTVDEDIVDTTTMQVNVHSRALWQFMRSGSAEVNVARDIALKQHREASDQIIVALKQDARYPWHLLALTEPPKFLSDIVESVLGAIYVDSYGDFATCEAFVQRLGILGSLERILRDGVDCLHPKERLGHLAVNRDVKYIKIDTDEEGVAAARDKYRCQVVVGGVEVGHPVKGLKRLNAETIAASIASRILEIDAEDMFMSCSEGQEFTSDEDGEGTLLDD